MANQTITQLPDAGPITGTELVPVVQNGGTYKTTAAALAGSPVQTQTFLTKNNEPTLANSRYLSSGTGVGITDGGAQSYLRVSLNGASGSLEAAGNGIVVKDSSGTVTPRSVAATGSGLGVSNANGVSGNPTFYLTGIASAIASLGGNGLVAIQSGGTASGVQILGTSNQITVANGNGASGNPTIAISSNPVLPGEGSVTIPKGLTSERPALAENGMFRYNTEAGVLEAYLNGAWAALASGSGVTSVGTGAGLLGGPITSIGTISIDTSVVATLTGTQTLTNKTINGANNTVSVSNALTIGAGLSGSSYDGSAAVEIAIDASVVTTDGAQALTNKTINGSNNSLSNIPNSALVNDSITIGSGSLALGSTATLLGGLTSVEVTQDPVSALQLATKQYVDAVAQGLNVNEACSVATGASLASITGGSVTYNNGVDGVGATLTLGVALTSLDGYALVNGDRVLVKNETASANNGIYTWATGGTVLTRSTDFDISAEISVGDFTFIQFGSTYAGTGWVQTQPVSTVGTDPIVWEQFSGAGTYTAGTGLTLVGNQFSLSTPVSVANGGTGQTSASAAFNALSPVTSTGDLIIGNGANSSTRLGIGGSGLVLKSTGTTAEWQLLATSLPITLHSGSVTQINVSSGYLPVLLHDGTTTVNVVLY
jgi:hypothetical protein